MTNIEKYMNTIVSIRNQDSTDVAVAMDIRTGALKRCSEVGCEHCKFNWRYSANRHCEANLVNWLFEKYQEPAPKLTKTEKGFCEIIKDGYIARDKNGDLYLYNNPPYVTETDWRANYGHCTRLCTKFFPFITWESNRNWSIEDLLKLEVCDD